MNMKEKLSINDYVFVIDEEDVINCYVTYNFDKIQITKFINENKIKSEQIKRVKFFRNK